MAIAAMMLRKKIDLRNKDLAALNESMKDIEKREAEVEKALEEAATDEQLDLVQENADAVKAERADLENHINS